MEMTRLTRKDTAVLKGFAILSICLHNFFHWLSPSPGENEFTFDRQCVFNMFDYLGDSPQEFINILFSYFGHYGVQLFVLLSGYGLAISMLKRNRNWLSFMVERIKKLYPLLLIGLLVYFLFITMTERKLLGDYALNEIVYKLFFIHTLLPDSGLSLNGPWWFFGLIFQLYLLFPLLFKLIKKYDLKAFTVICGISYLMIFAFRHWFNPFGGSILMQNAPGHLPEFCLGIVLAVRNDRKISPLVPIAATIIFVLGNFFYLLYPFTFLCISVMAVCAYIAVKKIIVRRKKHPQGKVLAYFGNISMVLFAVHGFFRTPFIELAKNIGGGFWANALSVVLFLLTIWGVAIAAKKLYEWLCSSLDKVNVASNRTTDVIGTVLQLLFGLAAAYVIGFYVSNALDEYDNEITSCKVTQDSFVVKPDDSYASLAVTELDINPHHMRIEGSFDLKSLDTTAQLPLLVIEMKGLLWTKFVIPNELNTTSPHNYQFSYDFQRSMIRFTKGRKLKLYLWNTKQSSVEISNATLKITY